jgi:Na+-translocating ferredoxin:NAD+ oxidoreductase RnfD subunit
MTGKGRTPFLPILITLIALAICFGFQSYQLTLERIDLNQHVADQEIAYKNSKKMRARLDGIATGASKLAKQGNTKAQQIVSAFAQRGVTINLNE